MLYRYFPLFFALFFFVACGKNEDLPTPDAVMVKFINKTGEDITGLSVSRMVVGELKKGKSSEYIRYDALGQQYGFALVEAVGSVGGVKFFTASACQGICGTPSAPQGVWLEPDYYKISIMISEEEPNALEFKLIQ